MYEAWSGAIAMALTFAAFLPYIRAILRGRVRPHVFSWIVWGINTSAAFFIALEADGGIGAWAIGFSAVVTLYIAVLGHFKCSDLTITRTDWVFFVAALAAMPLWYLMRDPLLTVWLVTLIELLGFGPTLRKTWRQPYSESMTFLGLMVMRNVLVITALGNHTTTTMLFPTMMSVACLALIAIMVWRRRIVAA